MLLGLILPHDRKHNRSHYEVAIAHRINEMARSSRSIRRPASGCGGPAVLDLEWKAAGYATLVVTGDKAAASTASTP